MAVIDCHHHVWWLDKFPHQFPPSWGTGLNRDYTPDDLKVELDAAGSTAPSWCSRSTSGRRRRTTLTLRTSTPSSAPWWAGCRSPIPRPARGGSTN